MFISMLECDQEEEREMPLQSEKTVSDRVLTKNVLLNNAMKNSDAHSD